MSNFKNVLIISWLIFLFGCATTFSMDEVMSQCETRQSFDAYAYCVKSTYDSEGNMPNASSVRAFYAHLEAINEAYRNKKITDAQAKSFAYDAYRRTIKADNDRTDSSTSTALDSYLMLRPQPRPAPTMKQIETQTTCYQNGRYINCTSR